MFKSVTLFLGKVFLKSPVVHHVSPKLVNVYFNNSKNLSPVILNLQNVSSVKFMINLRKGENVADEYILIALLDGTNNVELGVFESKKDAEEALSLLNIKVSSLGKFFAKWIATILIFIALFMVSKDVLILWSLSQDSLKQRANPQLTQPSNSQTQKGVVTPNNEVPAPVSQASPSTSANPVLTEEELMKLFEEAQRLTQAQGGSVNADMNSQGQGTAIPQNPNLTPADMFIQGLK